jgi:hypothetical protein
LIDQKFAVLVPYFAKVRARNLLKSLIKFTGLDHKFDLKFVVSVTSNLTSKAATTKQKRAGVNLLIKFQICTLVALVLIP